MGVFDTSMLREMPAVQLVGDMPEQAVDTLVRVEGAARPSDLETRTGQWLKHLMDDWRDVDPDRILRWLFWKYEGEHASLRRDLLSAVARGSVQLHKRSHVDGNGRAPGREQSAKKTSPVQENVPLHAWLAFLKQCESPFSRELITKFFTP